MGAANSTPAISPNEKTTAPSATSTEVLPKTAVEAKEVKEAATVTESTDSPVKSGCPMHNGDGTYRFSLWGGLPPNHPQKKDLEEKKDADSTAPIETSASKCPVQHSQSSSSSRVEYNVYGQVIDPRNQMPHNPNQLPSPQQTISLSTQRVASSIPKGGTDKNTWLYPSPQMFYNALQRKHKLDEAMPADDVEAVVRIHNQMNEATWHKIRQWEALRSTSSSLFSRKEDAAVEDVNVKLLKFQGRPSDLSPKAALKHYLLGHPLPFDRHDWVLERPGGSTTQRYVLDYYYNEHRPPYVMVDVRPALDSWSAFWQRAITMPFARYVQQSTPFDYLPLWPSPDMQSQVAESVQVWRQIQQKNTATPVAAPVNSKEILQQFQTALRSCQKEQVAVSRVNDEDDDAAGTASLQLSLCLGTVLCPIQVQAWNKVLDQEEDADGQLMSEAFDRLQECLALKSQQYKQAKEETQQRQRSK
jgi:cytochrome c heme-lyase